MMLKSLSFMLIFSLSFFSAQVLMTGKIINENQDPVSGVIIINVNTNERSSSDQTGNFQIKANAGQELRFIKKNYERISLKINGNDLTSILNVKLIAAAQNIEEVEIAYKVTGNLNEDSKHFGEIKKVLVPNLDLLKYNKTYSAPELMKTKSGEFKQPKGEGVETSKTGSKWDRMDLILYILDALGNDYFKGMGLNDFQMIPFIDYTIRSMTVYPMLRSGIVSTSDLAHFQAEAERQLQNFKNKP